MGAEQDEFIRREHTEELARLIPGAKLVMLPDVGHLATLQDPLLFNREVLQFLNSSSVDSVAR
jgi:pimeloyl-ACP methyl ester carboxylesterase